MRKHSRVASAALSALVIAGGLNVLTAPASEADDPAISGTVTAADGPSAGSPVPDVYVVVYEAATSEYAAQTTTHADGSYSVSTLAPGDYKVAFYPWDTEYADAFYGDAPTYGAGTSLHVDADTVANGTDVSLWVGSGADGIAWSVNPDDDLEYCLVRALPLDPTLRPHETETAADGSFSFSGLSPGQAYRFMYDEDSYCFGEARALVGPPWKFVPAATPAAITALAGGATIHFGQIVAVDLEPLGLVTLPTADWPFIGSVPVGQTVGVNVGYSWYTDDLSASFQWYADGTPIPGANAVNYTVGQDWLQRTLSAVVTLSSPGFKTETHQVTFGRVIPGGLAGVERTSATIGGTSAIGHILKLNPATYNVPIRGLKVTCRWTRNNKPIKGANKCSYKVTKADRRHTIRVQTTVTAPGYNKQTTRSMAVSAGAINLTRAQRFSGAKVVGNTITMEPAATLPATRQRYQWLVNGKPVKGATQKTYKIRPSDRGKSISLRTTYTAKGLPKLTGVSYKLPKVK